MGEGADSLNANGPLVLPIMNSWERVRKCGLVVEPVSLRVGFKSEMRL